MEPRLTTKTRYVRETPMLEYFLSYSWTGKQGQSGFGNATLATDRLIDSDDRVRDVEASLTKNRSEFSNVVLLSFQVMKDGR